jgi:hypothetical protein
MNADTVLYILAIIALVVDVFDARIKWFSVAAALLVLSLVV